MWYRCSIHLSSHNFTKGCILFLGFLSSGCIWCKYPGRYSLNFLLLLCFCSSSGKKSLIQLTLFRYKHQCKILLVNSGIIGFNTISKSSNGSKVFLRTSTTICSAIPSNMLPYPFFLPHFKSFTKSRLFYFITIFTLMLYLSANFFILSLDVLDVCISFLIQCVVWAESPDLWRQGCSV